MKRLSKILCPVDFTKGSYEAIEKASFLAGLYQADLELLHVLSVLPQSFGVVYGLDEDAEAMVRKAEERAREMLRDAKKKYVPYAIKCKSVIREGKVGKEILEEIEKKHTDMVVMAAEGESAGDPVKLGSKISEVVRAASCPVLTYHKVSNFHGFKKILIPVDPHFGVWEIREYVRDQFSIMAPEVVLLTIVDPDLPAEDTSELQTYLDNEVKAFRDEGMSNVKAVVAGGENVADAIARYGSENSCDLIMLYTHGRSGLGSMALSSITHNVINHCRMPVLSLRPRRDYLEN